MSTRMIVLVWALAALVVAPGAAAEAAVALEIDGAPITRIVTSHPLAAELAVAGQAAAFTGDGDTWTPAGTAVPLGGLVRGGGESQTWLAGEQPACMMGGGTVPMQRSADNGATWTEIAGTEGFRPLVLWPDTGTAVASSCTGLHISTDDGQAWVPVPGIPAGFDITSFGEVLPVQPDQRQILLGLTGEGGTSSLHVVDLSDPAAPVVTPDVRTYYAVGALTGWGETWVLGAMDGVWISADAGATWERHAGGLEDLVLAEDPAVVGLPENVDPGSLGISAISPIPGGEGGLIVGTGEGLYLSAGAGADFTHVDGTQGRVDQVIVSADGVALYLVESEVFRVDLSTEGS